MAIYHCSVKIGSRSKGQSAVAASAYRSGRLLVDEETGAVSDYTRKSGIVHSEVALCRNAPIEYEIRQALWNAVHEVEKAKNARLWREFEVALPQELNRTEQIEAVREFVRGLTAQGMCADWALHDKGDGNPHAHIMCTTRSIKETGEWAPKSRKVYDLDEDGNKIPILDKNGVQKTEKPDGKGKKLWKFHKEDYNNWNEKERVEEWREAWAKCCNKYLSEHDHIDHRSYKRQGIKQIPTVHEGYVARKMERKEDGSSRIVAENKEIWKKNRLIQQFFDGLVRIKEKFESIGEKIQEIKIQPKIENAVAIVSKSSDFANEVMSRADERGIAYICRNQSEKTYVIVDGKANADFVEEMTGEIARLNQIVAEDIAQKTRDYCKKISEHLDNIKWQNYRGNGGAR